MPNDFNGPRSICSCGHDGDGPNSQHTGAIGHGFCMHPDCHCRCFTWMCFTSEFETFLRDKGVNSDD